MFQQAGPLYSQEAPTSAIEAWLPSDQFVQALSAVAAAQSDGDVGWIQMEFSGLDHIIASAVSAQMAIRYEFLGSHSGQGSIKVSGRQLLEYVKALPYGKVTIKADLPTQLRLQCGGSKARYQLIQDQSLVEVKIPQQGCSIQAKGEHLLRWVESFREFVATDDTRYYANGACIWLEVTPEGPKLHAVASDSQRLAKACLSEEIIVDAMDAGSVLVPRKALEELKRVCAADPGRMFTLRWHGETLFFAIITDVYCMQVKCIAGKYPPWESALPQRITSVTKGKVDTLRDCIRRALLSADKNRILKMRFDGPMLEFESTTPGSKEGQETVELETSVEVPFEVNFNGVLLNGVLSSLCGNIAEFHWENSSRPVKILGEAEKGLEVFYLLVPTRF